MSVTTPYGLSTENSGSPGRSNAADEPDHKEQTLPMAYANPTAADARVAASMTEDELADALDLAMMHVDQARQQHAADLAELEAEEQTLRAEAQRRWGS